MGAFGGQVAVVTGASRGIGNAIALGLAAQGATVALVGRDEHALRETAAQARVTSPHVESYITNLTDDEAVSDLKALVDSDLGDVDILVHGAGVIHLGDVGDSATTEFDEQFATNVRAPYLLTKALLPTLRRRRGQVVFVNSSLGLQTRPAAGQYAATKHALRAFADTLRDEVNGDGVRVLSVYPGRTATPGQAAIHARERRPYIPRHLLQPEDVASIVVSALALPRSAEVTDIRIRPMHRS